MFGALVFWNLLQNLILTLDHVAVNKEGYQVLPKSYVLQLDIVDQTSELRKVPDLLRFD